VENTPVRSPARLIIGLAQGTAEGVPNHALGTLRELGYLSETLWKSLWKVSVKTCGRTMENANTLQRPEQALGRGVPRWFYAFLFHKIIEVRSQ
jgi:hypothetical protein